jgi:hypothetical protein
VAAMPFLLKMGAERSMIICLVSSPFVMASL